MATAQDVQVGFAKETTFKTGVTPSRFPEFDSETLDWNKGTKQGTGIRAGVRGDLSNRRVNPTADGGGEVPIPFVSKGLGLLLQNFLGASTSTLVSGATFQQVHTVGDNPSSLTVQKGIWNEATGSVDPITFLGCMASQFEIDFSNGDIVMLKPTFDVADIATATALATATFPAEPVNLFQFAGGSAFSGALTAPTTTALGSATTPLADIRGGSVQVVNNIRNDRFNMGGGGRKNQQWTGKRAITGKLDVEYDSTTFRDAVLNDTEMTILLQWVGGALSTGLETLQVILPAVKFDSEIVKANGTDLSIQGLGFTGLLNLTAAQLIYVVLRTADTAL